MHQVYRNSMVVEIITPNQASKKNSFKPMRIPIDFNKYQKDNTLTRQWRQILGLVYDDVGKPGQRVEN